MSWLLKVGKPTLTPPRLGSVQSHQGGKSVYQFVSQHRVSEGNHSRL